MENRVVMSSDDLWAGDGHVTDTVVDLVADGHEELLPAQVKEHVFGCEVCGRRMGEAIVLLQVASEGLSALEARTLVQRRPDEGSRAPVPLGAVLVAIVVSVAVQVFGQ